MKKLDMDFGREWIAEGQRLWLFLDYDGTLARFAPTPDDILPDQELIDLIHRLAGKPELLRVVVLSGRRLSHIQKLLPVNGILRAGTYGIEFQDWDGERVNLFDFERARPFLDIVKDQWSGLIARRNGFYLEDKGFSLAIHARNADDKEAREVIHEAARTAGDLGGPGAFRISTGFKFLEIAPTIADKGQSVSLLLKRFAWPKANIMFFGDDPKDEPAFKVVVRNGGTAVLVAPEPRDTVAQYRLDNPVEVRAWLKALADALETDTLQGDRQSDLVN